MGFYRVHNCLSVAGLFVEVAGKGCLIPFYKRAGFVAQEESKYRLSNGVEIACVPMVKLMDVEADVSKQAPAANSVDSGGY